MTIKTVVVTASGTFSLPDNLISNSITATARGGRGTIGGNGNGVGQTSGAILTAQIPVALLPVQVIIGNDALNGGSGADGFSGGGGPGAWHYDPGGENVAFFGGSGGGSTAVIDPDTATLYMEAGGGDGQTYIFGVGTAIPSTYPGGSGGGAASNTPVAGTNAGNGAGSGGAQGGNGGAGNGGAGGSGHGGGTNGDDASGLSSGAGVGSGGLAVQGAGACLASDAVTSAVYGVGDDGPPSVSFTYRTADEPLAPILGGTLPNGTVIPIDGGFADPAAEGVTLGGLYSAPSGDTGLLQAVALALQEDGGAVHYWNGTDFSSTSILFVAPTSGFGGGNGAQFYVVIPPGVLDDLHDYTWTFQTEESAFGLQGPAAATRTFHAVAAPTAAITGPAATNDTLRPTVSWMPTTPGGSQENYRFVIYDSPQEMGFSTTPAPGALYDTGLVGGVDTSFVVPADTLHSVRRYYGYLQIQNAEGSVPSLWTPVVFVISLTSADVTTLAVLAVTDPTTGSPCARLTMVRTSGTSSSQANFQLSVDGGTTWEDCIGGLIDIADGGATLYDLGAPFNVPIQYRVRGVGLDGGEGQVSNWSDPVAIDGVPSNQMWLVGPTEQSISMALQRLPSTSTTTNTTSTLTPNTPAMPPGLQQSIATDQPEQLGVFRPFGKKTAVFIHGDIWEEEFDLALYFDGSASWDNFVNIRNLQDVVLVRSDMEGTRWWVTMGGDMNAGIIKEAGRRKNPKRGLTIHCTPDDPFLPLNPYVPTN